MLTKILLTLSLLAGMGNVAVANPNNSNGLADRNSQFKFLDTVAKAVTVKIHVGEDRVSGVLIESSSSMYTVVTNSNIVNRGNTYRIETFDGVVHDVMKSNQDSVLAIGGEVLILQFESTNIYKTALKDIDDVVDVEVGETVIAAGFSDDKDKLLITQGTISHLFDRSLGKGYQIGFTNEIVSGMSGGVLLDSKGAIVGILGKGKDALIDDDNKHQDSTFLTPEVAKKIENNQFAISLAGLRVGGDLHLLESQREIAEEIPKSIAQEEASNMLLGEEVVRNITEPKKRFVKNFPKIDRIAEQITVRIDTVNNLKEESNGSGVIIAKKGKTYYGITAKHVLCENSNKPRCQFNGTHQIITADGRKYQLDNQTIVKSKGYDLAIFSFESDQDYQVATFGNYSLENQFPLGRINSLEVLVSGFPNVKENPDLKRIITVGQLHQGNKNSLVKDSYSLADKGQGLLYTNVSFGGMSGGAVLDADGHLLGINTGAEGEALIDESGSYQDVILGFSLGIPTQDIFNFLETETSFETKKLEKTKKQPEVIDFGYVSTIESDHLLGIAQKPEDDKDLAGWMNYGNQLWRFGRNVEAVQAFEKVTKIDPTFDKAYYAMGLAYYFDPVYSSNSVYSSLAIRALSKAIETNPNLYYYWRYLALSYFEAGFGKSKFKEYDRAAKAYGEAIKRSQSETDSKINFVLYSEYTNLLHAAGKHLYATGKYRKSLNAFNRAIAINPDNSSLYLNRALVRESLKQYEQAAVDYSKAIENYSGVIKTLDLHFAIDRLYLRRGFVYKQLNQYDKALANYDRVLKEISVEAKKVKTSSTIYVMAYLERGFIYGRLKQYEKALADYNQAIKLNPQDFEAYYNRGFIHTELKQYRKALTDYNQTFKINPKAANAYKKSGIIHALFGNFVKAKENVEEAARLYQAQQNSQEYQKTLQVLETIKLEEKKQNSN